MSTAPASGSRVPAGALRLAAERILGAAGVGEADAAVVADCLVDADARGVATHGLVRLPSYLAQIAAGEVDPRGRPVLHGDDGPVAWVDAARALGAVSSTLAMRTAIERAGRFGVGVVSVRAGRHFGAAAYYTQMAAAAGLIGVAATSTPGVMAPAGAADPVLGNNPISVAAPAGPGRPPFVLDMAQTAVARGRIKLAEDAGEAIPPTWAIDAEGRPTTDPTAALDGALLPFGGYKGSALAMAVEVLTGVASGSPLSFEIANTGLTGRSEPGGRAEVGAGALHLALDPLRLGAGEDHAGRVAALAEAVLGARPAADGGPPQVPGWIEAGRARRAEADGVPVLPGALAGLRRAAADLGVELPEALRP